MDSEWFTLEKQSVGCAEIIIPWIEVYPNNAQDIEEDGNAP